jgi:polyisoprenoid-binding protein YceI
LVSASTPLTAVGDTNVKFEAIGPGGLKINGASGGIKVSEQDGKVKIIAPTTQFQTGIGLRDRHLRDHLEAEKHPEATLVVERSAVKLPDSGTSSGVVTGQFTLHGVTKPAKVAYHVTRKGDDYAVQGDFTVDIQEFQIKKPCYLGVCVQNEVKVSAEFTVH